MGGEREGGGRQKKNYIPKLQGNYKIMAKSLNYE